MKLTKEHLGKLQKEADRLTTAEYELNREKDKLQEEVDEAIKIIKPICIKAISKFDKDPKCHIHIVRRESAVLVSLDNNGIDLDVRMRFKATGSELDEAFTKPDELEPYTKKLKALLDPMLKKAGIPLVFHSLQVPHTYYSK